MLGVVTVLLAFAGSIRAGPVNHRRQQAGVVYNCNHDFAYTWDDGPYIYHNDILDHFDAVNSKTTFFMCGNLYNCIYDEANVQAVRRTFEEGHIVAQHTWSHPHLTTLTYEQIDEEIQRTDEAFIKILGIKPRFLRPPYGDVNDTVVQYITSKYGKILINWSDDSTDWNNGSVATSYDFYDRLANEDPHLPHLTLSHEPLPNSVAALDNGTVTNLLSHGVNLVNVAACLDEEPYEYIGSYGERDETWTCDGPWSPPSTSTTTSATSTSITSSTSSTTSTASKSSSSSKKSTSTKHSSSSTRRTTSTSSHHTTSTAAHHHPPPPHNPWWWWWP